MLWQPAAERFISIIIGVKGMSQLFFLVEYNLDPLQNPLRAQGASAFLTFEDEIGLPQNASDLEVIQVVVQHKINLGIERIILTRDKAFHAQLGSWPVKVILLTDKTGKYLFPNMKLRDLAMAIILKADNLMRQKGQAVDFIDASKFY